MKLTGTERQLIHILQHLIREKRIIISPRKLYIHSFRVRDALFFEPDSNDINIWQTLISRDCSIAWGLHWTTDAVEQLREHVPNCHKCSALYNEFQAAAERYGELALHVSRCIDAHGRIKRGKYRWREVNATWQTYNNLNQTLQRLETKGLLQVVSIDECQELKEKFENLEEDLQLLIDADFVSSIAKPHHRTGRKIVLRKEILDVNPCENCTKRLKCAMRG